MKRSIHGILALLLALTACGEEGVMTDIGYGPDAGGSQKLDACVPPGKGPFPVAILVHGGGWGSGDKGRDFEALTGPLTGAGIVWFSINYRLAPQHRWPACSEDLQTALHWVRTHAVEFNGDADRIALIGYSAGGQIATLAALRADEASQVRAVVGLAPALDLVTDSKRRGVVSPALQNLLGLPEALDEVALAKIAALSPAEEIKPGLPPFLLVQGSADQSVRAADTFSFAEKLRRVGVSCDLIELKGAPHRIADWEKFDAAYPAKVVAWLVEKLALREGGNAP